MNLGRSIKHYTALATLLLALGTAETVSAQVSQYFGQIGAVATYVDQSASRLGSRFDRMRLGSSERLVIAFDLLGSDEPRFVYRIIHCNADWRPSALLPIEYVQGFESYHLDSPAISRNTLMPYAHYSLTLPNDQTQFKASGNYLVEISEQGHEHTPLLRLPFAIDEGSLPTGATVTTETPFAVRGQYQQVNVSISGTEQIIRPEDELSILVLQNGRWDNAVRLTQPSMRTFDRLRYDEARGAVFLAGNEYHKLEHLSERGGGMGINHTTLDEGLYALELFPVDNRSRDVYRYDEDHNGIQIIRSIHTDTPETEADYHLVDFTFRSPRIAGGSVILEGEAMKHLSLEHRTMTYDETTQSYRARLLLKMGYQEYTLLFHPEGSSAMRTTETLGNHYQTTNSYSVLVYRRSPGDRADRLVASLDLTQ